MKRRPPDRPGDPPPRRGRPGGGEEWRAVLGGGSSRQILQRLVEGDPLGVRERCRASAVRSALLLDPTRLVVRAYTRMAYRAARDGYDGVPLLELWLDARIAEAAAEIQGEDVESEMRGVPVSEEEEPYFRAIADVADVAPDLARRFCVVFNQLPHGERLPFFRVAVEGRTPEAVAAELDLSPEALLQQVDATVELVLRVARRRKPGRDGGSR